MQQARNARGDQSCAERERVALMLKIGFADGFGVLGEHTLEFHAVTSGVDSATGQSTVALQWVSKQ